MVLNGWMHIADVNLPDQLRIGSMLSETVSENLTRMAGRERRIRIIMGHAVRDVKRQRRLVTQVEILWSTFVLGKCGEKGKRDIRGRAVS
jgi:hypothetical protein